MRILQFIKSRWFPPCCRIGRAKPSQKQGTGFLSSPVFFTTSWLDYGHQLMACSLKPAIRRNWTRRQTMMKQVAIFVAVAALASLLSGCAAGLATATASGSSLLTPNGAFLEVHSETKVALEKPNFVVVKANNVGQSKGFALLGLITIVPPSCNTALSRLYEQAGVQPGRAQTLANMLVERSSSYWILFSLPEITVRGDLVEFVTNNAARSDCCEPAH
jgi:hypothetical protein